MSISLSSCSPLYNADIEKNGVSKPTYFILASLKAQWKVQVHFKFSWVHTEYNYCNRHFLAQMTGTNRPQNCCTTDRWHSGPQRTNNLVMFYEFMNLCHMNCPSRVWNIEGVNETSVCTLVPYVNINARSPRKMTDQRVGSDVWLAVIRKAFVYVRTLWMRCRIRLVSFLLYSVEIWHSSCILLNYVSTSTLVRCSFLFYYAGFCLASSTSLCRCTLRPFNITDTIWIW